MTAKEKARVKNRLLDAVGTYMAWKYLTGIRGVPQNQVVYNTNVARQKMGVDFDVNGKGTVDGKCSQNTKVSMKELELVHLPIPGAKVTECRLGSLCIAFNELGPSHFLVHYFLEEEKLFHATVGFSIRYLTARRAKVFDTTETVRANENKVTYMASCFFNDLSENELSTVPRPGTYEVVDFVKAQGLESEFPEVLKYDWNIEKSTGELRVIKEK